MHNKSLSFVMLRERSEPIYSYNHVFFSNTRCQSYPFRQESNSNVNLVLTRRVIAEGQK